MTENYRRSTFVVHSWLHYLSIFLVESNVVEVLPSGCEASSVLGANWLCLVALDMTVGTDWATSAEGTGSWIKVGWDNSINKLLQII